MALRAGFHGTVGQPSAQVIDGSLRFDDGSSQYLNRSPSSVGNKTVWSFSFWIKLNKVDGQRQIFSVYTDSSNDSLIKINSNGYLEIWNYRSGSYQTQYISDAQFRDPSAWYHFVVSANGSTSLNAWVNGEAVTWSTSSGPNGVAWLFNNTGNHQIGRYNTTANSDFQLTQVNWIDGQALGPEEFGFTDPLTNTWRPKKFSGSFTTTSPNDGTTWTNNTTSGSGTIGNAYDGASNTWCNITSGNTFTLTPPSTIVADTVEVWLDTDTPASFSINGGTFSSENTYSGLQFVSVATDVSLTSLAIKGGSGGSGIGLRGIRINGEILLDGFNNTGANSFYLPFDGNSPIGQDRSGIVTPNNGSTWSNSLTSSSGFRSSEPKTNAFDGNTSSICSAVGSGTITFTSPVTFASNSTIRVFLHGGDHTVTVNGGSNQTISAGSFQTVTYSNSGNATFTMTFHRGGGADTGVRAIEIDNHILVDGQIGNNWTPVRFGNTNKIDSADLTGGTTILNTNEAGTVALPGHRSDPNASNLVVALPMVGAEGGTSFNDIAYLIKGSGSSKSFTAFTGNSDGGGKTSTRGSVLYGSSFYTTRGATNSNAGDYIERTGDSDLSMGTGDYCIEFWYHPYDYTTNDVLIDTRHPTTDWPNDDNGIMIYINVNGDTAMVSNGVKISGSGVVGKNQDNHFALTREGTTERLFVNGNLVGTATNRTNDYNRDRLHLGSSAPNGEGSSGYYNDLRVYKGIAKYTSSFKVGSPNPTVLPDTPSGVSGSSKLTKITDGAVTFDGTDYLTVADGSNDFSFGTGAYTVEGYLYPTTLTGNGDANPRFFCCGTPSASSNRNQLQIAILATGAIRLDTNGANYASTAGDVVANKWQHIAVARDGSGNLKAFVDGRQVISQTSVNNDITNNDGISLGIEAGHSSRFTGFMSNVRILKGTALYTSNFTPPSAPLTNVTNTKLLCCQSNTSANLAAVSPATFSNDGTVWSSSSTISSGGAADGKPLSNGFDGSTSTAFEGDTSGATVTVPVSATISAGGVRVYAAVTSGNPLVVLIKNGSTTEETINTGSSGGQWYASSSYSGPITSLVISRTGRAPEFNAIEINGCVLVDGISGEAIQRAGDAAATNFNPFNTDINTVRGQETGYCTFNVLRERSAGYNPTFSDGNLFMDGRGDGTGTLSASSGKFYYEVLIDTVTQTSQIYLGVQDAAYPGTERGWSTAQIAAIRDQGAFYGNGSTGTAVSYGAGDLMSFAFDTDNNKLYIAKNGVYMNGGNPSQGTGFTHSGISFVGGYTPIVSDGQTGQKFRANFGQKPFKFPPPEGFQPLNAANVRPETVIARPDQYVGITTWEGDDQASHVINDLNFDGVPDFVWIKRRDGNSVAHQLYDTIRGATKPLVSSATSSEDTQTSGLKAFVRNGFELGASSIVNGLDGDNGNVPFNYVAWCWKAGGNKNTFNVDDVGYANASDVNMSIGGLNSSFYNQSQTWSNDLASDNGNYFGTHTPAKAFDGNLTSTKCTSSTGTGGTLTFDLSNNNLTGTLEVVTNTGMSVAVTHSGGTTTIAAATSPDQIETLNFGSLTSISQIVVTGVSAPSNAMLYGVKLNGVVLIDSGVSVTNFPTIAATGCSVGTKQGFSIVKYTGNSTANATLAHGLSEAPKFVIIKNLSNSYGWAVLHTDAGTTGTTLDGSPEYYMLYLNGDAGRDNWSQDTIWNPTSTTVKIDQSGGANWVNNSNSNYIMYAWHDVPGLQKFGLYAGNNASAPNGPFVELGFRPALVMIKRQNGTGNWIVYDNKRDTFNPLDGRLYWNTNSQNVDNSGYNIDFLSNGFRITGGNNDNYNASSNYVYAAWAETPSFNLYGGQSNAR